MNHPMNQSNRLNEKIARLEEERELEQIRKFEAQIEAEYGPIIARGKEEVDALFRKWERERDEANRRS